MNKRTILAVVIARAGSKRIPNKNKRIINGNPLIVYTFQAALSSKYITQTIISTDDSEIMDLARATGVEVPFVRPPELSNDFASSDDVIIHALSHFDNKFDMVIKLQPTSPLRDGSDIDSAIEYFFKKQADSVVSVCKSNYNPYWVNKLPNDFSLDNFLDKSLACQRSQDVPALYSLNGAIYIAKVESFLKEKTFFLKQNSFAYVMSKVKSVDIDEKDDFRIAEGLLRNEK